MGHQYYQPSLEALIAIANALEVLQKSIIDLIEADASISIDQMAVKRRTLEREIAKMKQKGYISRTGSPRSGKWEVIIPYNSVIEIV
jgi:DNA-binding MarR family transcriptional regulator